MPSETLSIFFFETEVHCTGTLDSCHRSFPDAHNYRPGLSLFWSTTDIPAMQVDTHIGDGQLYQMGFCLITCPAGWQYWNPSGCFDLPGARPSLFQGFTLLQKEIPSREFKTLSLQSAKDSYIIAVKYLLSHPALAHGCRSVACSSMSCFSMQVFFFRLSVLGAHIKDLPCAEYVESGSCEARRSVHYGILLFLPSELRSASDLDPKASRLRCLLCPSSCRLSS